MSNYIIEGAHLVIESTNVITYSQSFEVAESFIAIRDLEISDFDIIQVIDANLEVFTVRDIDSQTI